MKNLVGLASAVLIVALLVATFHARLDPLDPRATLRGPTLEVVDEGERPIEEGWIHSTSAMPAAHFRNNEGVDLSSTGEHSPRMTSAGYPDAELRGVTADSRAVMRHGAEVRLVLGAGLQVPQPPYCLGVKLVPLAADPSSGPLRGSDRESCFDDRGELLTVAPVPGYHFVLMTLTLRTAHSRSMISLSQVPGQIIHVADREAQQTFALSLDLAAYEEARASLDQRR